MLMKAHQNNAAQPRVAKAQTGENYFAIRDAKGFGPEEITQVLVVSDLHLGEGQLRGSAYWDRLENFTCDAEFKEFLQYKQDDEKRAERKPDSIRERDWPIDNGIIPPSQKLLVLNGDFIDFLRIMRTPPTKRAEHSTHTRDDWGEWKTWLEALKKVVSAPKLNEAIGNLKTFQEDWTRYALEHRWWHYLLLPFSKRLRAIRRQVHYGLDTEDFKSIYRLEIAAKGHEEVFDALHEWLRRGSAIAIVSGNHDQEMDQELVQAWFRHKLKTDKVRLQFFSQGVELCEQIRLEHGHRYEWHTRTEALARDRKSQPVTLPPGSFFNRFFVNKIETVAPYLDNVRPITRVVSYLFRSHTLEALGLLGQGFKAALRLLFSRNTKALRFLGYSFLALCNALLTGLNVGLWAMLFVLANCRAFVTHLVVLVPALVLTGVLFWAWNQIAQLVKTLVTSLLRKPETPHERHKPSKYVWRRLAFFAIVLTMFVWPLIDAILWWRVERDALSWQILFQNWPAAESLVRDFFTWLLRGLSNSFQTIILFFAPLFKVTLAAWGLRLLMEGLRPHFKVAEIREKMTDGWEAPSPRFISCGHTHIPDKRIWEEESLTYLNSGTWNLVFEYESDVVRDDLSKTFVEFILRGHEWEGELWRWEPPKIRENKVVLLEPRHMKTAEEQAAVVAAAVA